MESEQHNYFIVRTAPGKEDKFMDSAYKMISKKEDHGIYSLFRPESVKGYVFAEAESLTKVVDAFRSVPNSKGVIRKEIDFSELEQYFDKEAQKVNVNERDIVEVVAGPFKGDQGRVTRLVPGKDEVVIEPLNSPVPIPITLSIDDVRVINEEENSDFGGNEE
ncbi:MAG: transcription elongation factor Spt5 [Nanoarchaeota archaeon]|nr:transcription elongation factor Spt5 [Nanoarchaeota archaeon]